LARLEELLDAARRGRSGVLVLSGEPGIGKTALWRAAREMAEGIRVLSARGVSSESELPFAGLAELFAPVVDLVSCLPPRQRAAMEGALALGPAVSVDALAVGVATLGLLAAVADRGPVLCAVDDLQWVDVSSAQALTFAARRLHAEGVAMIFTKRPDDELGPPFLELDLLVLAGLSAAAAAEVLSNAAATPVDAKVARSLHDSTGGNPLALVELPRLLSAGQLEGSEPLQDPLPPGPTTERAFRRRIAELDPDTRSALLLAAASGEGDLDVVLDALRELGIAASSLESAEEAGIISVENGRVEFRHPLLRSAAYHGALALSRRRAHAALAAVLADSDARQPWHLAAAALGPDEAVAAALERVGIDARGRGAHAGAARALGRAAQLTPEPDSRARRLGEASADLHFAGRPEQALVVAADALAQVRSLELRADIELVHSSFLTLVGQPNEAYRRLMAEAARLEQDEPGRAAIMQMAAVIPCYLVGDGRLAYRTAELAHASAQRVGGPVGIFADAVLAQALVIRGDVARGRELLEGCLPMLLELDPIWGPHIAVSQGMCISYLWVEQFDTARRLLERIVVGARAAGAPGLLPFPLWVLADLDFRTGAWDAAYSGLHEALELAHETGQSVHLPRLLAGLARIEAQRGQSVQCRDHLAESLARGTQLGTLRGAELITLEPLGLLEFAQHRFPEAAAHLDRLAGLLREEEVGEPSLLGAAPERIEALARSGRTDEATEALIEFERHATSTGSCWGQAAAARCRGSMASPETFEDDFESSLRWHDELSMPFERARTELAYGECLRRAKQRTEARQHLRRALESFQLLGAQPWIDNSERELAATGETARRRGDPAAAAELTPQELRVALAVAEGASNREAATALFLSPKTIEFHLGSVYRKLGIRSRTELARRFAR
jgi:DNA-binding CsgD family transcriptional regulator